MSERFKSSRIISYLFSTKSLLSSTSAKTHSNRTFGGSSISVSEKSKYTTFGLTRDLSTRYHITYLHSADFPIPDNPVILTTLQSWIAETSNYIYFYLPTKCFILLGIVDTPVIGNSV